APPGPAPEKLQERTLVDRFLSPATPPPPPQTQAARLYFAMVDSTYQRAVRDLYLTLYAGRAAFPMESKLLLGSALRVPRPDRPDILFEAMAQFLARTSPTPLAVQVLAVREARRGVLAHPNEAIPHLVMGLTYTSLPEVSKRLRPLQIITAFRQAQAR